MTTTNKPTQAGNDKLTKRELIERLEQLEVINRELMRRNQELKDTVVHQSKRIKNAVREYSKLRYHYRKLSGKPNAFTFRRQPSKQQSLFPPYEPGDHQLDTRELPREPYNG